ncbi:IclR family transcriptional regulator [Sinorhizobium sp. BG8]|uniref:IclR family transcriptional regulator n=1 Tax=Sinorhizobium sp. BG8 TaxID=2613773 RepID=UPI00193DAFE6|nr:IclR family transcriptional regulator [Sinorhizobium sp. BG8]QRM53252.1 IclR family transcriptional regulator [Sinorhizobium sp. BG8]
MDKMLSASGGSVERTIAMLELLALAEEPLKLSEIAHRLAIPKSASHRILTSLLENGWARQSNESDCYALTIRMALIGQKQLDRLEVTDLKQPILNDLAERTRELVRLTAVQNNSLVWIGSARGRRSGLVFEPDMSATIVPYATANGKIWLASIERELALRIALETGLGQQGQSAAAAAIRTIDALNKELDETARQGYGRARGEAEEGVGAIAVAVKQDDRVVGTMSVAAPLTRLTDDKVSEIVPLLERAASNMAIAWETS